MVLLWFLALSSSGSSDKALFTACSASSKRPKLNKITDCAKCAKANCGAPAMACSISGKALACSPLPDSMAPKEYKATTLRGSCSNADSNSCLAWTLLPCVCAAKACWSKAGRVVLVIFLYPFKGNLLARRGKQTLAR